MPRTNIRIYSYPKNDTNEYPNKYSDHKSMQLRAADAPNKKQCDFKFQENVIMYLWCKSPLEI